MPFPHLQNPLRLILWFTAFGAAIGVVYSRSIAMSEGSPRCFRSTACCGLLTGTVISSILISFEAFVLAGPIEIAASTKAPFAVHVAAKSIVYLVVILFGLALGAWVFPTPIEHGIQRQDVLFSLAASFVFTFMYDVSRLLGRNVLLNFVTGRYHRPRLETRVFLFIDMEGSTGFAERLGALVFHRLLNRFVVDLTEPIVAARGEIHSYVGDEVIATWARGRGRARPLRRGLLQRDGQIGSARARLPARI